jgi:hypothetical protein
MVECFQRNLRSALYALIRSETLAAAYTPGAGQIPHRVRQQPEAQVDYPSNTDSEIRAERARLLTAAARIAQPSSSGGGPLSELPT